MAFVSMKLLMSRMSVPGAVGDSVKQRRGEVCQDHAAQYRAGRPPVSDARSAALAPNDLNPPMWDGVIYPPTTLYLRHGFFHQYFP